MHVHNAGVAFGLLNDAHLPFKGWLTTALAALALAGIAFYARHVRPEERLARLGLSLILGGAIGNLIDRLSARLRHRLRRRVLARLALLGVQRRRRVDYDRRDPRLPRSALRDSHMHPILFEIGGWPVYSYGVLLAARLSGRPAARRHPRASSAASTATKVMDLGIYLIIAALVGAKLMLIVVDFDYFRAQPRELLSLVRAGGVFYGGLIAAFVAGLWLVRRYKLPIWTTADLIAPGIALGHVVGRFGCLLAGLLLRPADGRAVGDHVHGSGGAPNVGTPLGMPLHPTQLYDAGAELLILVLLLVDRAARQAVRRAARSGCTCCSTRSRASSSSSTAATRAA